MSVTVTVADDPFVLFRSITITQVVEVNTAVADVGTAARACDATVLPHAVFGIVFTIPITFDPVGSAFVIAVTAPIVPESTTVWRFVPVACVTAVVEVVSTIT